MYEEIKYWDKRGILCSLNTVMALILSEGTSIKNPMQGFPGGAVVESLPANAGDTGSSPGLGRSHVLQSSWAREPQLLSLRVWSLCSARRGRDSERPAHRAPLATTRESPRTETKTQHSHKKKNKKQKPNAAEARRTTILQPVEQKPHSQKDRQDEKAEGYVPDEGTR